MQLKRDDGEFYKGMFKGYRESAGSPHNRQPDNNVYLTAIAAFGLHNMLPYLTGNDKTVAANIVKQAASSFPYFKNKSGQPFYNFWPSNGTFMPHTVIYKHLKNVMAQGEDADDAVMILMASDADANTAMVLKQRLVDVANLNRGKKIISTYQRYSGYPAYSTWLGTRMAPDFDLAVHCNILYFVLSNKLPLVKQDSATMQLVAEMVKNREYMQHPLFVAPYYIHSTVLLYHICRLMGAFNIPELEPYRAQLANDIRSLLPVSYNIMEQIILRTSLLRLGQHAPPLYLQSTQQFDETNQQIFVFGQGPGGCTFATPIKKVFLHWSYARYYFYCPAYNRVLWLEYLVEKRRREGK
jgi:hypothetical protein